MTSFDFTNMLNVSQTLCFFCLLCKVSLVILQIFVNAPGNEVKLLIKQNTAEVRLYQSQIQK